MFDARYLVFCGFWLYEKKLGHIKNAGCYCILLDIFQGSGGGGAGGTINIKSKLLDTTIFGGHGVIRALGGDAGTAADGGGGGGRITVEHKTSDFGGRVLVYGGAHGEICFFVEIRF